MKSIYLLLLSFILCSYAQAQNTFEKVIDTLGSAFAYCVQETFDGGYAFCGVGGLNGNDALIAKLDSVGTIEWVKLYNGPGIEIARYVEQLPDSGYIVNASYDDGLYSKSWLLRLDTNGDTLWTKTYSIDTGATNVRAPNSLTTINNMQYGLTGYFQPQPFTNNSAYFLGTLTNGTLLSSKIYNISSNGSTANAITNTFDSGFMMVGDVATSIASTDLLAIRVNSIGDTLWTKKYNHSPSEVAFDVKQMADSGFIIAGITGNIVTFKWNIYLIRTDSAGDTLWTKMYYSTAEQNAFSVQKTTDEGFITAGSCIDSVSGNYDVYILKTDSNGDTLWTRRYGGTMPDFGYFIRQTKDGGYVICGRNYSVGNGGIYLIKTDSMGNVLTSSGTAELNNPFDFLVFPNPSSGVFTISIIGLPENKSVLEIYDLNNHLIYSCDVLNCEKDQIDISNMHSGMYLIILRMKDGIVSKKIVIEKSGN